MATPAKNSAPPALAAVKGNASAAPAAAPAKAKSRKTPLKIAIAVAIASGATAGGWAYMQQRSAEAKTVPQVETKKQAVFLPIDQFTVNLPGAGGDHFLQIAFTLEVTDSTVADEIKRQMPIVRGRLLMLLASKTVEELSGTAGKQKLMAEILAEARVPLADGTPPAKGVENVHFSAFVIQ